MTPDILSPFMRKAVLENLVLDLLLLLIITDVDLANSALAHFPVGQNLTALATVYLIKVSPVLLQVLQACRNSFSCAFSLFN